MEEIVFLPNYGKVKCGKVTRANHPRAKKVSNFIEIPFAQPPIGKLRFQPPKRALPWTGILFNTKQTKIPPQTIPEANESDIYFSFCPMKRTFSRQNCSEDCLYLNVFAPVTSSIAKLPVMVWFYGGSFQVGPRYFFDGTALAGMNDVIVVVPHYRVNTFGFLCMGSDTPCKGNFGLHDQLEALKWVKENIEYFGGDKDNVTVFGESAGAISIHMHMMSSLSESYFHKAICFSGSATVAKVVMKDQSRAVKKFLEILKIKETSPEKILKELQSFSMKKLCEADYKLRKARFGWYVTIDNELMCDMPKNLLSEKRFQKITLIIGCNSSEGGWLMNVEMPNYLEGLSKEDYQRRSAILLKWLNRSIDASKTDSIILRYYNQGNESTAENDRLYYTRGLAGVMADCNFNIGIILAADGHADCGATTYFYHMKHPPCYNHDREYGPEKAQKPSFIETDHADDIIFTWGFPFLPDNVQDGFKFSREEMELSLSMMTYFANFAKTGNPNKGVLQEFEWPTYNSQNRPHIVLDIPLSKDLDFGVERYNIYTNILPNL
ncbi:carboxylesterase 5A-like [Clavelina lepadiformis]|uniref:carboxylesterase 5A-like n=1 Tax=Clavelina lepadiformis TaxID=159417 RepID=UPI00404343AD